MNISKKAICLVVGLMLGQGSFAGGGSGVRGGGHTIDVDSTPYLMDLVSRAVCDWKKGDEFIEELQELREGLKNIARLDWYFASDLEREIRHLNFCMTGPLYKVPAHEWDSVTRKPKEERTRQVGYRLYGNVYIDSEIYGRMDEGNQSMLIIHEAMHAYLYMDIHDRALKLRSMVKVLDKVRRGELVTREKFRYAMRMNEITFPLNVEKLDSKKEAILFLTGSVEYKRETIKKIEAPEKLVDLDETQVKALAPWDGDVLRYEQNRINILKEALIDTMLSLEGSQLALFMKEKKMEKMNLSKLALSEFYLFSEEQQEVILQSENFNEMLDSGFNELLNATFEQKNFLIMASADFRELVTGEGKESAPLVRLMTPQKLPGRLMWIVETIVILQKSGVVSLITENENFYQALGLKNQKNEVIEMVLKVPRERDVALRRLSQLSSALIKSFLTELQARFDEGTYEEVLRQIDLSRF